MASKKSAKKVPSEAKTAPSVEQLRARPFAESPAPEHCRVDLCTARAEWMRTLYPKAPQPVFSTRALEHGTAALGAKRLKEGFAFTPSMDLVWALGFPDIAFIVDGVPVPDTVPGMMEFYRTDERMSHLEHWWWETAQKLHGRIYTRRAAIARTIELSPYKEGLSESERANLAKHIFELDEETADAYTSDSEVTDFHLRTSLLNSHKRWDKLHEDVPMLVALVGPVRVTETLIGILENDPDSLRPRQTTSALLDLFHLLPEDMVESHRARLRSWCKGRSKDIVREISWCITPEENLAKDISRRDSLAEFYRRVGRGVPQAELDAAIARELLLGSNDVFIGDTAKILRKVSKSKDYEPLDIEETYLEVFSSIRSPEILEPLLKLCTKKEHRSMVLAWLAARAEWAKPHLDALSADKNPKLKKIARDVLDELRP